MVTNIKRNDCRLFHSGLSISKKERRRKLIRFNLATTEGNSFCNVLDTTELSKKQKYTYVMVVSEVVLLSS